MKTSLLKYSVWIIAVLMTGLVSCEKSDDQDNSGQTGDFYLTAKIDAANFTADLSDVKTWGGFKYHSGTLTVSVPDNIANVGEGTIMLNLLDGYKGAGTYTVGVGGSDRNYARFTSGSVATNNVKLWSAEKSDNTVGTGTIVITSDKDGVVEGSFQFDGYNSKDKTSKKITDGKFRLKIN